MATVASVVAIILVLMFFISGADANTYVLGNDDVRWNADPAARGADPVGRAHRDHCGGRGRPRSARLIAYLVNFAGGDVVTFDPPDRPASGPCGARLRFC